MAIAMVILRMDMLTNQSLADVHAVYSATEGSADLIHHRLEPSTAYRDSFYTAEQQEAAAGGTESVYAHILR